MIIVFGDEMSIDYLAIGKKIAARRKELGLTQEQLAEEVGISYSHIGNIERGKTKLSLQVFADISNVLKISSDYLLLKEISIPEVTLSNEVSLLLSKCSKREAQIVISTLKTLCQELNQS